MNINDQEMVEKTSKSTNNEVLTERPIYFGGTDFTVPEDSVGSTNSFAGCISDITLMRQFVNMASIQRSNIRSASFGDCGIARIDSGEDITGEPLDPGTGEGKLA